MYRYAVVIECPVRPGAPFGAYAPEVPNCLAVADSKEAVSSILKRALSAHLYDEGRKGRKTEPRADLEEAARLHRQLSGEPSPCLYEWLDILSLEDDREAQRLFEELDD